MRFTHVDPFEDTERTLAHHPCFHPQIGFTHVDPFEDTESLPSPELRRQHPRFTHVDPFEDTERLLPLESES